MLTEVRVHTRAQAVADQIVSLIKKGYFKAGDHLPTEVELMRLMKVGRSTVREAKRLLAARNLIESRAGRGTVVRLVGADGAIDRDALHMLLAPDSAAALHEAREILETEIAALAAQRATGDDLTALAQTVERMRAAFAVGEPVSEAALGFHVALVEAAHNPVLSKLYRTIVGLLTEIHRPVYAVHADPAEEVAAHRTLLEAVRSGDPRRARKAMREHLRYVRERTLSAVGGERAGMGGRQPTGGGGHPRADNGGHGDGAGDGRSKRTEG